MANCPKCNAKLKLTDWRQHCPHCGANMVIYDLQERLMQDADIAEVQNYHFQKKIDRLKASFVGSKLAVVRIFTTLLPIAALFLPIIGTFSCNTAKEEGVSALTLYENIDGITGNIGSFFSGSMIPFAVAFVLLVLSILMIVVKFVCNTLSCSPKGKPRNIVLDIIMLVITIASFALFTFKSYDFCFNEETLSSSVGIGSILYAVLMILSVVIDVLCVKQGIPVKHAQCYVGGIPIEEYFKMQEDGWTREQIREEQYKRLTALQQEKEAKLKADEEAKAKAEADRVESET